METPLAPKEWQRPEGADRQFFCIHFQRLMIESGVGTAFGSEVLALCSIIALQQDRNGFTRPVTYHNTWLQSLLGISKWESFDNARRRAVDSGWLFYRSNGSRKPGSYGVSIPADASARTPPSAQSSPKNGYDHRLRSAEVIKQSPPESSPKNGGDRGGSPPGSPPASSPENGGPSSLTLTQMPPLPSARPEEKQAIQGDDWSDVLDAVVAFGVANAPAAFETAKQRGCTPVHIRGLLNHATANRDIWASPAGALYTRISNAHPLMPTDEGWPAPNAKAKARAELERRVAADTENNRQSSQLIAREQNRLSALEEEFGPTLNAMSGDERARLADQVFRGIHRRRFDLTPDDVLYREQMLKRIRDHAARASPEAVP